MSNMPSGGWNHRMARQLYAEPATNTQADGEGAESAEEMQQDARPTFAPEVCSYCGVTYTPTDGRQRLCLHCTVEDYL